MKPKKERMYMASMIQQPSQQISTESLAHQKRKAVTDNSARCGASSFFFPFFRIPFNRLNKINSGISFRHHGHTVSYASVVESPLPPLPTQTEEQNDNQSKIQQESG